MFGIGVADNYFSRVPADVVALARRWLAAPAIALFDDIKVTELEASRCFMHFGCLMDLLGWKFDPRKDSPPSSSGPFLGVIEDCSLAHTTGVASLQPRPEVEEALTGIIQQAFTSGSMLPH